METGKPRLLVLTSTFPRWEGDSTPRFIFDLCRRLAATYHVTVLAPHAPGAKRRETMDDVNVVRFRYGPDRWEKLAYNGGIAANLKRHSWLIILLPAFLVAQCWNVLTQLRLLRPATIHAHWIIPQGAVMALMRVYRGVRPRTVCTLHGGDVLRLRGQLWGRIRKIISGRCDHLTVVSENIKLHMLAEGCPTDKITVLPMGADLLGTFSPGTETRSAAEILFAGRLVSGKGADTLLRAFPALSAANPEATLRIVGDGPEKTRLMDLARRLGMERKVAFVGGLAHTDVAECLRRATLFVLPSESEGFGLSLVEAMGCGCPVAASDLPAIRDLLRNGEMGRLFRPADPADLARVVSGLLRDATLREKIAARARAYAADKFDWTVIARQYAAILAPESAQALNR